MFIVQFIKKIALSVIFGLGASLLSIVLVIIKFGYYSYGPIETIALYGLVPCAVALPCLILMGTLYSLFQKEKNIRESSLFFAKTYSAGLVFAFIVGLFTSKDENGIFNEVFAPLIIPSLVVLWITVLAVHQKINFHIQLISTDKKYEI